MAKPTPHAWSTNHLNSKVLPKVLLAVAGAGRADSAGVRPESAPRAHAIHPNRLDPGTRTAARHRSRHRANQGRLSVARHRRGPGAIRRLRLCGLQQRERRAAEQQRRGAVGGQRRQPVDRNAGRPHALSQRKIHHLHQERRPERHVHQLHHGRPIRRHLGGGRRLRQPLPGWKVHQLQPAPGAAHPGVAHGLLRTRRKHLRGRFRRSGPP